MIQFYSQPDSIKLKACGMICPSWKAGVLGCMRLLTIPPTKAMSRYYTLIICESTSYVGLML